MLPRMRLASEHVSLPLPDGFVENSEGGVLSASSAAEAQEIVVTTAPLRSSAPVAWMLKEPVLARQKALAAELGAEAFAPLDVEAPPGRIVRAFVARAMPLVFSALVANDKGQVVVTLSLYQYSKQTPGLLAAFLERAGKLLGALSIVD
jgi:hypothetical protein